MLLFRCVDRQIYYRVYGEYKSSGISYQCSSILFLRFSGESILKNLYIKYY
nr:MAG TPA: hypothetical protein [Caudoviricetes sp.]